MPTPKSRSSRRSSFHNIFSLRSGSAIHDGFSGEAFVEWLRLATRISEEQLERAGVEDWVALQRRRKYKQVGTFGETNGWTMVKQNADMGARVSQNSRTLKPEMGGLLEHLLLRRVWGGPWLLAYHSAMPRNMTELRGRLCRQGSPLGLLVHVVSRRARAPKEPDTVQWGCAFLVQ